MNAGDHPARSRAAFSFLYASMPSVFSNLAAAARAAHQHFFGNDVSATVSEPGTSPRTLEIVLGREVVETRREDNRDVRYLVRECRFLV